MAEQSGKDTARVESARPAPGAYQMIRTIEIENFRGIQKAHLRDLKRINVLVGPNGTGKTAFLEALYLAGGNTPENMLKARGWRGRQAEITGDPQKVQEMLWLDVFRDHTLGDASVRLTGDDVENRSVTISKSAQSVVMSGEGVSQMNAGITFEWKGPFGAEKSTPVIMPAGISMQAVVPGPATYFLPARMHASESEGAAAFSRLSVAGNVKSFLDSFTKEFPWLSEIGVEAPTGFAAIYARLPSGRKLPLSMISGGVNHLAALMLRIADTERSVLLIDEIENGFYFENYASIWRTLYDMAVLSNAQIFATTHSLECLQALSAALANEAGEIRFMRSRLENNEVEFEQLSGPTLFKALKIGDVR